MTLGHLRKLLDLRRTKTIFHITRLIIFDPNASRKEVIYERRSLSRLELIPNIESHCDHKVSAIVASFLGEMLLCRIGFANLTCYRITGSLRSAIPAKVQEFGLYEVRMMLRNEFLCDLKHSFGIIDQERDRRLFLLLVGSNGF